MQHEMASMSKNAQACKDDQEMWYVASGASNHMIGLSDWFENLKKPEIPGYV